MHGRRCRFGFGFWRWRQIGRKRGLWGRRLRWAGRLRWGRLQRQPPPHHHLLKLGKEDGVLREQPFLRHTDGSAVQRPRSPRRPQERRVFVVGSGTDVGPRRRLWRFSGRVDVADDPLHQQVREERRGAEEGVVLLEQRRPCWIVRRPRSRVRRVLAALEQRVSERHVHQGEGLRGAQLVEQRS